MLELVFGRSDASIWQTETDDDPMNSPCGMTLYISVRFAASSAQRVSGTGSFNRMGMSWVSSEKWR